VLLGIKFTIVFKYIARLSVIQGTALGGAWRRSFIKVGKTFPLRRSGCRVIKIPVNTSAEVVGFYAG